MAVTEPKLVEVNPEVDLIWNLVNTPIKSFIWATFTSLIFYLVLYVVVARPSYRCFCKKEYDQSLWASYVLTVFNDFIQGLGAAIILWQEFSLEVKTQWAPILLAMSVGYQLFDMIDISTVLVKGQDTVSFGYWILGHHMIIAYGIAYCCYFGSKLIGLALCDHIAELSNIFLHSRKLLCMCSKVDQDSSWIYINKTLFIGTFVLFRMGSLMMVWRKLVHIHIEMSLPARLLLIVFQSFLITYSVRVLGPPALNDVKAICNKLKVKRD